MTSTIETEDVVERFRAQILISSNIRGGSLNHLEDHEVRAVVRAAVAASGSADTIERLREERDALQTALAETHNERAGLREENARRGEESELTRIALRGISLLPANSTLEQAQGIARAALNQQ